MDLSMLRLKVLKLQYLFAKSCSTSYYLFYFQSINWFWNWSNSAPIQPEHWRHNIWALLIGNRKKNMLGHASSKRTKAWLFANVNWLIDSKNRPQQLIKLELESIEIPIKKWSVDFFQIGNQFFFGFTQIPGQNRIQPWYDVNMKTRSLHRSFYVKQTRANMFHHISVL